MSMDKVNSRRQVQEGIGECLPRPPQTPPIQRSWRDRVKVCSQLFAVIVYLFHCCVDLSGSPGNAADNNNLIPSASIIYFTI